MLRRLELHGFKTFATRTALELEPGVTAVVGPNGSGKSNLTEAVRWVLGEQSMRAIRSRKSEDVIFAGSGRRAAAGMAEVTVTLDNSAGALPLPFAEVSVTRRAYRSGESEYLINGERARLRDVTDLLSRAGLAANGHVVVGQGLVDAALSARPEERRTLFEDAAGISHHQARLADSRDKLNLTEGNLARVADIAAEIAPRLPGLAKQSERARQALALRAELDSLLFGWYSQSWRELREKHERLAADQSTAVGLTSRAVEALASLDSQAAALAARRDAGRRDLAERERMARELLAQTEVLRRDLAGARERQSALAARVAETERDLVDADAIRAADEVALAVARKSLGDAETALAERVSSLGAIEAESAERQVARRARESRLRTAEAEASRAAVVAAEARARADGVGERRRSIDVQLSKLRLGVEAAAARVAEAAARRRDAELALAKTGEAIDALAAQRASTDEALAAARSRQQILATERGDIERQLRQLEARRDLLTGWRESQGGYYSGVRAVLQAARRSAVAPAPNRPPRLDGVVGPVGELVEVPANLETAIETALGGHLQDVVVERWEHAEAAIEMLKSTGAGRATFLPLDTLRPAVARPPAQGPGVLGVARDLVGFDARLAVVFDSLLGHTLVVEDLPTARRVLRQLIGGWQIVTVAGEIVRTSGAVTGGSQGQAQRGVLARERELRQLPAQIEKIAETVRGKAAGLAEARAAEQDAVSELTAIRRREGELGAQRRTQEGALGVRRREEVACEQQAQLNASEESRLVSEIARLDGEAAKGGQAIAAAETTARHLASALESLRAELLEAEERDREHAQAISERRAARAVADAERRAAQSEVERRSQAAARATRLVAERQARLSELRGQSAHVVSALAAGESELLAAEALSAEARAGIAPAAASLAEVDGQSRTLEAAITATRSALEAARERERVASLVAERARLECAGIVRQIELDLGPTEEIDGRLLLQVGGASVELAGPTPDLPDPAGRIQELRRALRGAGSASPEVIAEYESAKARHEFLTTQTRDLEAAAETLRQAIGDLEETMRRRFLATFDAVGEVFARNFTRLFGGGSASLGLTQPERPAESGIEVTVQLPGKRGRNLAQLSGGERALTAVALIFALLEVNPTPFCIFDEVDAALDEANIDRFCDLLRERSQLTQFVVITHNRRTMEAANALYGLSMEDRSVSKVFSLKLAEAR